MIRIAVLFGTFNPIHNGHLIMSTVLLNSGKFDKVMYVVSNASKKKGQQLPHIRKRMEMIGEAFQQYNDDIFISDIEIRTENSKYTYNCLKQLQQEMGPDCLLSLIVGGDQMSVFGQWFKYQELLNEFDVHCILREGQIISNQMFKTLTDNNVDLSKTTMLLDMPRIDISSTKVRELIKDNKSTSFYIPKFVRDYIDTFNLYRD